MAHSQGAVSLLEAIASMDEPFDPPDLLALPAAAPLRGHAHVGDPSFAFLPANSPGTKIPTDAHHPEHVGHDEENCIDCWLYRAAHVPWERGSQCSTVRGAQQRLQSAPLWEGRKRAHPAGALDDVRYKRTSVEGARGEFQWGLDNRAIPARALTAPTTPTDPHWGASARAVSETPLGARDELRWKLTQRLARSSTSAAPVERAGASASAWPRGRSTLNPKP
ncbi:hypothetical protein T484DRAFT_2125107 [Baffinella frigidus]|nr:hypothetical protein T484DRAFT_2125107 [Cryptophyta sp. CCMP2293]